MSEDNNIETRTGLPEHLRVLADKYPREIWQGHPNFNELTSFWLERHLMFRQVLGKLQEGSAEFLDGRAPRYVPEMARYTGFLLEQLHGHHNIEDHHYFPKFKPFDARLDAAFDLLDADHHALDGQMNALAEASNAVIGAAQSGGDVITAAGHLREVQGGFERFLNRHLCDEEEVIVPIVLEYGDEIT